MVVYTNFVSCGIGFLSALGDYILNKWLFSTLKTNQFDDGHMRYLDKLCWLRRTLKRLTLLAVTIRWV